MNTPDLSGVDPVRQAEIKRRIAVLDRYIALTSPSADDAKSHAAELGLGIAQFYRLVKSWRIHADPKLLGTGRRVRRSERNDGVSANAKRIAFEVIRELGADTAHSHLLRETMRRCRKAGVKPPSAGALWTYVMDSRPLSLGRTGGARSLVIGRIWAKVPTRHSDGSVILPEIAVALLLPDKLILGWDANPGDKPSLALAMARAIRSLAGGREHPEVVTDAGDIDELAAVHIATFGEEPSPAKRSVAAMLSANLGRTIGGMGILHRPQRASTARLLKARNSAPASPEMACAEIERAIVAHNRAVSGLPETP